MLRIKCCFWAVIPLLSFAACIEPILDPLPGAETPGEDAPWWECTPMNVPPRVIATTVNQPMSYVLTDERIYYTDWYIGTMGGGGRLYAGPRTGGGVGDIVHEVPRAENFDGLQVLAADDDYVYWSENYSDGPFNEAVLMRLALIGQNPVPEELMRAEGRSWRFADESYFYLHYWEAGQGYAERMLRTGGELELLGPVPSQLDAVDGQYLYGTGLGSEGVWKMPKQGGEVTGLVDNSQVSRIVLDADAVYYFEREGVTLSKVAKSGGAPEVLYPVEETEWIGGLAVDDEYVYFTRSEFTIRKLPKTGGEVENVVCLGDTGYDRSLRVIGDYLFWIYDFDGMAPGIMTAIK